MVDFDTTAISTAALEALAVISGLPSSTEEDTGRPSRTAAEINTDLRYAMDMFHLAAAETTVLYWRHRGEQDPRESTAADALRRLRSREEENGR